MAERNGGVIVTPISTSSCVEAYVTRKGGTMNYTRVGAPIVAHKMMEVNAIFGGEENGGLIFPNHQYCRDSGMASVTMLEVLAKKESRLSELINEIPYYHLIKTKVKCENLNIMKDLKDKIRGESIDYTDGIKVYLKEGWVLIRPSGTEPLIRIYAEGKTEKDANTLAITYEKLVQKYMK